MLVLTIINLIHYEYVNYNIKNVKIEMNQNVEHLTNIIMQKYNYLEVDDKSYYVNFNLNSTFYDKDYRIIILDHNNYSVFDNKGILYNKKIPNLKVERKTDSNYYKDKNGQYFIYNVVPVYKNDSYFSSIFIMKNITDIFVQIREVENKLMIYSGLFIVFFSFILFFYFLRSLSPLEKIIVGVSEVTRGKYDYKIKDVGSEELMPIVNSFNIMASRLNEIEKQQSEFISNLSHEVRTPITSIKIIADSLVDSKENIDKEIINEFLVDIRNEADRLKELVDELLYMATLEKKDLSLNLEYKELSKAISAAISSIKGYAKQRKVTVKFDKDVKILAEYDYNKFVQLFINIIGNAVKYNYEDGYVNVVQSETKNEVIINVIDNGRGIPEKDISRIFDRFYRVSYSRVRDDVGGTGLGMSISKEIINLHRGVIIVKSIEGKGTNVMMKIPKKFEV